MTFTRFHWPRLAAIGVATAVAAWLVLTTTIGSVFAKPQPDIAVAWAPRNAEARGYRALRSFSEQATDPQWAPILRDARAALARSPANVPAVTVLALHANAMGRGRLAERLFTLSDRMSRHEPIVQIYLIEAAVARGDIDRALDHYDAALSISRPGADLLMPVLVAASADPAVARPLAKRLARRPAWWADFTRRLVQTRQDPGAGFPILLNALRLDAADPTERIMLSSAIDRLMDSGHGAMAYAFYRRGVPGAPASPVPVRDGDFEGADRLAPIDWDIRDSGGVSGVIEALAAGGRALFVSVDGSANSEVARQRLLLAPGRYHLAARIGSEDRQGGETAVSIVCDANGAIRLARVSAPAETEAVALRASFTVPADCPLQRLSILGSPAEQPGRQSWVDGITITSQPR